MKRCIDCDYKCSCGKANSKTVCEEYKKTPKTITKLDSNKDGIFKFSKIEVVEDDI